LLVTESEGRGIRYLLEWKFAPLLFKSMPDQDLEVFILKDCVNVFYSLLKLGISGSLIENSQNSR